MYYISLLSYNWTLIVIVETIYELRSNCPDTAVCVIHCCPLVQLKQIPKVSGINDEFPLRQANQVTELRSPS